MSWESENAIKKMQEYIEANATDDISIEDMDNLIKEYMENYNNNLPLAITEENAKTSDDYCELAEKATTKQQALKYARKAVQLDENNIDARIMVAELTTEHPHDMIEEYRHLIEYSKKIMEEKGYMTEDSIGHYWGILETRPFIRLLAGYLELLLDCGMMRKAAEVGEEIIKLNENDNLGIRYRLMHIYAYLEEENSMLVLHKKYDLHEETQMLFPLSILYYKLGQMDKSEEYLRRLNKSNKDTKKFIRAVINDKLDKFVGQMNPMGYRPFSVEEFLVEMDENTYLFRMSMCYFDWAYQILKKASNKE